MNTTTPNLDPSQLRQEAIAKENAERFEKISKRLLDILVEEKATVVELPVIISIIDSKVNVKIKKAEINQILKLNEK